MTVYFEDSTHTYRDEYGTTFVSVTQILKLAGKINHFGNATEEQAAKGTSIHWLTRLEDEGKLNARRLPKSLKGYRKAWVNWKAASGFIPTEIETPFISDYGYAGTIDRVGYFDGNNRLKTAAVVDIKSGSVIPECTGLQLVAYAKSRFSFACRRIAVRLLEDGTYRVKEYPLKDFGMDWATFYLLTRKYGNH